ncbi:MAG: hypothetical protein SGPRY_000870, partial [Prymnesium sp.]
PEALSCSQESEQLESAAEAELSPPRSLLAPPRKLPEDCTSQHLEAVPTAQVQTMVARLPGKGEGCEMRGMDGVDEGEVDCFEERAMRDEISLLVSNVFELVEEQARSCTLAAASDLVTCVVEQRKEVETFTAVGQLVAYTLDEVGRVEDEVRRDVEDGAGVAAVQCISKVMETAMETLSQKGCLHLATDNPALTRLDAVRTREVWDSGEEVVEEFVVGVIASALEEAEADELAEMLVGEVVEELVGVGRFEETEADELAELLVGEVVEELVGGGRLEETEADELAELLVGEVMEELVDEGRLEEAEVEELAEQLVGEVMEELVDGGRLEEAEVEELAELLVGEVMEELVGGGRLAEAEADAFAGLLVGEVMEELVGGGRLEEAEVEKLAELLVGEVVQELVDGRGLPPSLKVGGADEGWMIEEMEGGLASEETDQLMSKLKACPPSAGPSATITTAEAMGGLGGEEEAEQEATLVCVRKDWGREERSEALTSSQAHEARATNASSSEKGVSESTGRGGGDVSSAREVKDRGEQGSRQPTGLGVEVRISVRAQGKARVMLLPTYPPVGLGGVVANCRCSESEADELEDSDLSMRCSNHPSDISWERGGEGESEVGSEGERREQELGVLSTLEAEEEMAFEGRERGEGGVELEELECSEEGLGLGGAVGSEGGVQVGLESSETEVKSTAPAVASSQQVEEALGASRTFEVTDPSPNSPNRLPLPSKKSR